MRYMAFIYEEDTHDRIYVCYGKTKREATGLFFTRVKGLGIDRCWLCKAGEDWEPESELEMVRDWLVW